MLHHQLRNSGVHRSFGKDLQGPQRAIYSSPGNLKPAPVSFSAEAAKTGLAKGVCVDGPFSWMVKGKPKGARLFERFHYF